MGEDESKQCVPLHAINYRFSFTKKSMGVEEEYSSFKGFGIFSCLSDLNFPLWSGNMKHLLLAGLQIVRFQIIISNFFKFLKYFLFNFGANLERNKDSLVRMAQIQ